MEPSNTATGASCCPPGPGRQTAGTDVGVPRPHHLPDPPVRGPGDRPVRHPVSEGAGPHPTREQTLRPGDRRVLEQYLNHLRIERGLSANTLSAYRRDLVRYLSHLAAERIDPMQVDPAQVTEIGRAHV